MTPPGEIRVSPDSRPPPRIRSNYGVMRDARLAWVLTGQAIARLPLLFLAVATLWGLVRFLCLQGLYQAHLGLGGADTIADFEFWARIRLLADIVLVRLGPLILCAVLIPPIHRMILDGAASSWLLAAARAGKILAALLCLSLLLVLALGLCAGLPLLLQGTLGRVSTLLLLILLLPLAVTSVVAVLRFSLGLPAVSLGLPRGLAEGWMISRNHVLRSLCVAALAALPAVAASVIWLLALPDPYGWPATILRPITDVLSVALSASVSGLLYRAYRLPAAFRPDRRPSHNRTQRRHPVFT